MSRISILISGLALIALSPAIAVPVAAQQLPPRPIRVVVPFSPAGFPDRIARVLANEWSETLRQRVYVENKPGAGGMIGTAEGARAEPDGTTLVISSMPTLVISRQVTGDTIALTPPLIVSESQIGEIFDKVAKVIKAVA